MDEPYDITHIEEIGVYICNDCGAHARSMDNLRHYPTCKPGESKKWADFYAKANEEEGGD